MWISTKRWDYFAGLMLDLSKNINTLREEIKEKPKVMRRFKLTTATGSYSVDAQDWTYNYASGFVEFIADERTIAAYKDPIVIVEEP